jgi:hypothetical protein
MAAVEFLGDRAALGPILLAASAPPLPMPEGFEAMAGNVLAHEERTRPLPGLPDGVSGLSGGALLRVVRGLLLRGWGVVFTMAPATEPSIRHDIGAVREAGVAANELTVGRLLVDERPLKPEPALSRPAGLAERGAAALAPDAGVRAVVAHGIEALHGVILVPWVSRSRPSARARRRSGR